MVKILIYTGLSLPFSEAKEILDSHDDIEVVYKRPIKRGDLSHDIKENPDIIAIIDGVFHQNSAVGHREILSVMKKGVKVYGSSSMGALRASELDVLGMEGIGYCYNEYASGNVTSDDDVAVMLDSETLEALSVPLISMNYVFTNATSLRLYITKNNVDLTFQIYQYNSILPDKHIATGTIADIKADELGKVTRIATVSNLDTSKKYYVIFIAPAYFAGYIGKV